MIREIKLKANAKLNLTLDIVGVREDGYHLMDMVNRSVGLCDTVTIKRGGSGIRITSNARFLPRGDKNLGYRAAEEFFKETGVAPEGIYLDIQKRIPTKAGLAGGSADAAAVLVGLNEMFETGLSQSRLIAVGERLGADVPFCIVGGSARVTGIGEIIEPVEDSTDFCCVILMPKRGKSTREAFAAFDEGREYQRPDTGLMLSALKDGDIGAVAANLRNAFATAKRDETTERLVSLLLSNGALGASLTGSGAAVFGVFKDFYSAKKCRVRLFSNDYRSYIARAERRGIEITEIKTTP